jgi:hypothetical protein
MTDYISQSMTNHYNVYTSSEDMYSPNFAYDMQGGSNDSNDNKDRPTGGFPPIFILTNKEEVEQVKSKNRELVSNKATISIRDILASKK